MNRRIKISLGVVVAWVCGVAAGLGPGGTQASDGHVLPGSACRPAFPISGFEYFNGKISYVSGSGYEDVHCPIIRDTVGSNMEDIWVSVDHTGTGNNQLGCDLSAKTGTGLLYGFEQEVTSGTGDQTLHFDVTFGVPDWAYYRLNCQLEPGDDVNSIRWNDK